MLPTLFLAAGWTSGRRQNSREEDALLANVTGKLEKQRAGSEPPEKGLSQTESLLREEISALQQQLKASRARAAELEAALSNHQQTPTLQEPRFLVDLPPGTKGVIINVGSNQDPPPPPGESASSNM